MKRNRYTVQRNADGRWEVFAETTFEVASKKDAVRLATLLARADSHEAIDSERAELRAEKSNAWTTPRPAQVVVRKADGRFEEERTYPRSSDPRRTKG